jgi:hypothetical protein
MQVELKSLFPTAKETNSGNNKAIVPPHLGEDLREDSTERKDLIENIILQIKNTNREIERLNQGKDELIKKLLSLVDKNT